MFGNDPNWGRIAAAVGYSGAKINPDKIDIYLQGKKVVSNGVKAKFDKRKVTKLMKKEKLKILVDIKVGKATITGWGCDLNYDYVEFNSAYHT